MEVKRFAEAKAYAAPNHRNYASLRLFGLDAGGPKQFVVGLSHFLPGGGAGPRRLAHREGVRGSFGRIDGDRGGKETVLKANDSCFIGPNEEREIINRGNDVVTMMVAMSAPRR